MLPIAVLSAFLKLIKATPEVSVELAKSTPHVVNAERNDALPVLVGDTAWNSVVAFTVVVALIKPVTARPVAENAPMVV